MGLPDGTILLGERRRIDRTGLKRITKRVFFSSYQAAMNGAYQEIDKKYQNALFVSATGSGDEAGNWIAEFEYESVINASDENIGEDIGLVEELDFSTRQDPIGSHPDFNAIITDYPWDDNLKAFKQLLASGQPSPVYGTIDFLSFTCTYRQIKTMSDVPSYIFENIGTIITDPPFHKLTDPAAGDERTWLYLAPKISTRGNSYQIAQEWILSGYGSGWIEDIYGSSALSVLSPSEN